VLLTECWSRPLYRQEQICPERSYQRKTATVSHHARQVSSLVTYCSESQRNINGDEHANRSVSTFVEKFDLLGDDPFEDIDAVFLFAELDGKVFHIVNAHFDGLGLVEVEPAVMGFFATDVEAL
jgi:hypothetical protein